MNNNGMKVLLVILIVICFFQGCGFVKMAEDIDYLHSDISNLENMLNRLEWRIREVESNEDNNDLQMDVSYGIDSVDWENGVINVEFTVSLNSVTENTSVSIGNGNNTAALTKSGNQFVGIVSYPINDENYETILYKYNGASLEASESIEWINEGNLMEKYILCQFDGLSSYGNGKLTLAGTVDYTINVPEQIAGAKLIAGDEIIELGTLQQGRNDINVSKEINMAVDESGRVDVKELYLEVTTEEGIIYRAYPEIYAYENYKVNVNLEDDENYFEEVVVPDAYQNCLLEVVTPQGKTYSITIYAE